VKIGLLKSVALLVAVVTFAPKLHAQEKPRIIGMAHMAYYVSDLKQARDLQEHGMPTQFRNIWVLDESK
jgi:hypothetical protein